MCSTHRTATGSEKLAVHVAVLRWCISEFDSDRGELGAEHRTHQRQNPGGCFFAEKRQRLRIRATLPQLQREFIGAVLDAVIQQCPGSLV